MTKRIVITLLAALLFPAMFWVGGFDFDKRGEEAALLLYTTIFAAVMAWTWPGWYE